MRRGVATAVVIAAVLLSACSSARVSPHVTPALGVWSRPATLTACSGPLAPSVVFPQQTPFRRTGDGAIVFAGDPSCAQGAGALIAPIGSHDTPGHPRRPRGPDGPIVLAPPLESAATTEGQIVLVGSPASDPLASTPATLSEGPADGEFAASEPLPGRSAPIGLAIAYRGDVAIASEQDDPGSSVQLRVQPWSARRFAPASPLNAHSGSRRALAVALDYRTDALAVWWQDGWLWAREHRVDGTLGPLQRFARAGPHVQLSTLISDDGRAIVAWTDPSGNGAKVYLDISAPLMRLGLGTLVEHLHWRRGTRLLSEGAVRLVRLSTESVLMAWTGTEAGHFVVRAAGIDLQGLRTTSTISSPGEDAQLQTLATGPRGDALALWSGLSQASAVRLDGWRTLMASRGVPSSRGLPHFDAPAQVAPPGSYSYASVAIDPDSDRAVASWRDANGAIFWATRSTGS